MSEQIEAGIEPQGQPGNRRRGSGCGGREAEPGADRSRVQLRGIPGVARQAVENARVACKQFCIEPGPGCGRFPNSSEDNHGTFSEAPKARGRARTRARNAATGRCSAAASFCRFTAEGIKEVDYKDIEILKDFINENGRIIPARITGTKTHFPASAVGCHQARHVIWRCCRTPTCTEGAKHANHTDGKSAQPRRARGCREGQGWLRAEFSDSAWQGQALPPTRPIEEFKGASCRTGSRAQQGAGARAGNAPAKLEGLMIQITQKAGVDGRLFGSVTNYDIAEALKAQGP